MKKVTVLLGGVSAEREVSLNSGRNCAEALKEAGYVVSLLDPAMEFAALIETLRAQKPDVVFNALHGRIGEDGHIQAILNLLKIPYTHSGLLASAIAMDKPLMKDVFRSAGLPVPDGKIVLRQDLLRADPMARPFVTKPPREGSSVGVRIVSMGDNSVLSDDWSFGEEVLVERYIPGRELTVGIMNGKAMEVTELRPHDGFFDYKNKYTSGRTEHLLPAPVSSEVREAALSISEAAYNVLGCRGVARTDLRYDDSLPGIAGLFLLEINTQPGMTALSLVPEQAKFLGVNYPDLVRSMVEVARCD